MKTEIATIGSSAVALYAVPDTSRIKVDAKVNLEIAQQMTISTEVEAAMAKEFLQGVRALRKEIEDTFDPLVANAYRSHKALTETRKGLVQPIVEAESMVKEKLAGFLEAEAERRMADGLHAAKPEGVKVTDIWKFEIVDESAIPREYLIPDMVKIGQVIRTMRGLVSIPGIRAFKEKSISVA